MKKFICATIAVAITALLMPLHAQPNNEGARQSNSGPLAPFERLIGGQWHLEGSYQEFEWGVGQLSVKARSYFMVDGKPMLVSDGVWFWHPGEKKLKGVFTAINMPVTFFDYTTRFEGSKMVNDLRTYGAKGSGTDYIETWDFRDDSHFVWKLQRKTAGGLVEEMSGTYTKKVGGDLEQK